MQDSDDILNAIGGRCFMKSPAAPLMAAAFHPVWGYTPAAPEGVDTFHLSVLPPVRPTIALLRTPRFPQRSGHLLLLLLIGFAAFIGKRQHIFPVHLVI